jgi:hypothetical protein
MIHTLENLTLDQLADMCHGSKNFGYKEGQQRVVHANGPFATVCHAASRK